MIDDSWLLELDARLNAEYVVLRRQHKLEKLTKSQFRERLWDLALDYWAGTLSAAPGDPAVDRELDEILRAAGRLHEALAPFSKPTLDLRKLLGRLSKPAYDRLKQVAFAERWTNEGASVDATGPDVPSILARLKRDLMTLCSAISEDSRRRANLAKSRGGAPSKESRRQLFVGLAVLFRDGTGRQPHVSKSKAGEYGGHFLRFASDVIDLFKLVPRLQNSTLGKALQEAARGAQRESLENRAPALQPLGRAIRSIDRKSVRKSRSPRR